MRGLLLCLLVGHLAPALAFAPRCSAVASAHVRQGAATRPTGAAALRSRASSRQRRSATMELAVRSLAGREAYESALAPVTPSPDGPEQYTVVKYYASWCRACKALGPKVRRPRTRARARAWFGGAKRYIGRGADRARPTEGVAHAWLCRERALDRPVRRRDAPGAEAAEPRGSCAPERPWRWSRNVSVCACARVRVCVCVRARAMHGDGHTADRSPSYLPGPLRLLCAARLAFARPRFDESGRAHSGAGAWRLAGGEDRAQLPVRALLRARVRGQQGVLQGAGYQGPAVDRDL
jgi:hypothetical protein